MRDSRIFTLSNGIRVVHQKTSGEIVHCGIFLEIGSRDESHDNQGITHFWEHMAFKGTKRRRAFHIINSLDSIGGELNAYTEKEKVVFYASVRRRYFERAVDILSDITFHSVFPSREIKKELGVILEEMAMYHDDPDDSLLDEFENVLFRNHPLGMNILGREETLQSFRKKDFTSFISNHIDTNRIVFSCVGNISLNRVEEFSKKYFECIPTKSSNGLRQKFLSYRAREVLLQRPVKQARCAIGRNAFPIKHKYRIPFYILVNLLGGPGMNSRLNLSLRERHGYVYSVEAQYIPYSDTGLFAIFFGTEPQQLPKCINLVKKELEKLCEAPLGKRQLATIKEQIKGQLAMAEESNLNLMLMMGRSVLDFGQVPTLQSVYDKIDAVDSLTLQVVAQKMFDVRMLSILRMEPVANVSKQQTLYGPNKP